MKLTQEDMIDKNIAVLNQKDLEKAVGGTFNWNYYWQHEYEEAGIKDVTHFIAKDEYGGRWKTSGKRRELRGVFHRGKRLRPRFA